MKVTRQVTVNELVDIPIEDMTNQEVNDAFYELLKPGDTGYMVVCDRNNIEMFTWGNICDDIDRPHEFDYTLTIRYKDEIFATKHTNDIDEGYRWALRILDAILNY